MALLKLISRSFKAVQTQTPQIVQICGMKHFPPPPTYDDIILPDRRKLPIVERQPNYLSSLKPPKMQKRLRYMRGPETVHNFLIYKQYGIRAVTGGRLRWKHFDIMRLVIGRQMDQSRMFAVWRADPPWQPITKKGQGQRMGGGKGAIDHYVTPVKAGRILVELGGKCEFSEVQDFLQKLADRLPFKAEAISYELMEKEKLKEEENERKNLNKFSMKYCIQNNMGGCQRWISKYDYKWFCKYV